MKITANQLRNLIVEEIDYLHKKDHVLRSNLAEGSEVTAMDFATGPLKPLKKIIMGLNEKDLVLMGKYLVLSATLVPADSPELILVIKEGISSGALKSIWDKTVKKTESGYLTNQKQAVRKMATWVADRLKATKK